MTNRINLSIVVMAFFVLTTVVSATDRLVPGEYSAIQAGMNAAVSGDRVIVSPGTYSENITFTGANIILESSSPVDWSVVEATVIQGDRTASVVTFTGSEDDSCRISGFTITGGYTGVGGGIVGYGTGATVSRCNIIGNNAAQDGGGVHGVDGLIESCHINNSAMQKGGGLANCNGTIVNCVIAENYARQYGGGLHNCDGNIVNCTVAYNYGRDGGQAFNDCDSATITNCIITGSEAFLNSVEPTYSCFPGGSGNGNIDADPDFTSWGYCHLNRNSPCIDAGTNDPPGGLPPTDFEGFLRPLDGDGDTIAVADMGAYEFDNQVSRLAVSPVEFEFSAVQGGPDPNSQTLSIHNWGGGTLSWEIIEDCSWLVADPNCGELTGETDNATLNVNVTGLTIGIYTCTLTVSDPCALNSPQEVDITLYVDTVAGERQVPAVYATIQMAIDAAIDGDTVILEQGTYYENINFNGKNITVTSTNPDDPAIVAGTVIDANGSGSAVTFENGEGPDAVITGFTITGGIGTYNNMVSVDSYYGGGVYCYYASPTITRNVISGNIGLSDPDEFYHTCGGGIACLSSSAIIARNVIKENEAFFGGGIYIWDVRDVGANPTITNNIINGNEAIYGAGIHVDRADTTIANNLICDNSSIAWPFPWTGAGVNCDGANIIITNNILWANLPHQIERGRGTGILSVIYSNVECGWPGEGNIKEDPLFVDAANGDYHLQVDSPCINTGDPGFVPQPGETDFDGNPRVLLGRLDIGPYEFGGNLRPVADAGADQAISDMPGQVTLDGSDSSDPDNDPLSYRWNQTFGPEVEIDDANAAITTFSPTVYGAYTFELVVNDGSLDSFADRVNIVVGSGHVPVADAGLSRYAGNAPVELDGTGSYDPDTSGSLSYQWQQISGPAVTITSADTTTPTISGFTLTDSIQTCEFALVVSDGQYSSLPDIVEVIIVHDGYLQSSFRLESGTFDPEKPTIIHFGRGGSWGGGSEWNSRVNILSEITDTTYDYFRAGDKLILYLSSIAPSYSQPIQLSGCSGGAWASIEVAAYMNRTYQDRRYAVNHVTLFDGGTSKSLISRFLISAVDGEQCWVDSYLDEYAVPQPGVLNVDMYQFGHCATSGWYKNSLTGSDMNDFNSPVAGPGVVAGAYWSVIGPGKNLQLAYTPDAITYYFQWHGSTSYGYMDFYDESSYSGRLPEPVTLIEPAGDNIDEGVLLTCQESQNAVGYQLLVGADPYRVMDFDVISDTPAPPTEVITEVPKGAKYWTIKVRDEWGSTIYADPVHLPWLLTVDLATLAKYWLNSCTEPEWCDDCDIDRSGSVNFIDFAVFAENRLR